MTAYEGGGTVFNRGANGSAWLRQWGVESVGLAAEFSDLKRAHGESYESSFGKEVAAKYPLHAAAADGRAEDLVAGMAERQKAGDLPAGNHTAPTRCFLSPQPAEP